MEVISAIAEFMPDGHMLASLTEDQLRHEVELEKSILREKLLSHIDAKLRSDGDYHSVREPTGLGVQAGCVFLSHDSSFDSVFGDRIKEDLQSRGYVVVGREGVTHPSR